MLQINLNKYKCPYWGREGCLQQLILDTEENIEQLRRPFSCFWIRTYYNKNKYIIKNCLQSQCNTNQISKDIFHRTIKFTCN